MIKLISKRKYYLIGSIITSLIVYLFGLYITFDYKWILEFINFETPENRLKTFGRLLLKIFFDVPMFFLIYEHLNKKKDNFPHIKKH